MPKVSVIVPFYNVELYIERCARSLFGQTLDDMEYIFVDDCSTDSSVQVLNDVLRLFPDRESSTHIVRLPENGGQAKALREGLKLATGNFVIKCDGDDEIELESYEELYDKAVRENLDLVIFDFVQLYSDGSSLYMGQHLEDDMIYEILTNMISTSVCNKLVRRDVLKEPFVYPEGSMCEDFVFSIQYFYRCLRIGSINKPYYKYYRYPTSFLAQSDLSRHLEKFRQLVDNMNLVFGIINEHGDTEKYKDQILFQKLNAKNFLLKYIGEKDVYKIWRSTFREINKDVLGCPSISNRNKFFYILTALRLYPLYTLYKTVRNK